ncbi:MAG: hypothetical protein FWC87_00305 [Acidimicrobiaceae bacterium]|nr:hypothetical protein [Acidimicrobiaceae bacterium]
MVSSYPRLDGLVNNAAIGTTSSLEDGTAATLRLIADPDLECVTGRYFSGEREAAPHEQAHDPTARGRLRDLSDQLCELH